MKLVESIRPCRDHVLKTTKKPLNFCTTSQARVFTYARRCDKDPGSGWSRDSFKNLLLSVVGKVSNYMLPHISDTFQMQGARCNGSEK